MDRTARMLRRTLLCAVFACPLAAWRYPVGQVCHILFALSLLFLRVQTPLWPRHAAAPVKRVSKALLSSIALEGLYYFLPSRSPALGFLFLLSGLLLQGELLYRLR